jgi:hypothetical protein
MKRYSDIKRYDSLSNRNIQENEERNETVNIPYFNTISVNTKEIHAKQKEFR